MKKVDFTDKIPFYFSLEGRGLFYISGKRRPGNPVVLPVTEISLI